MQKQCDRNNMRHIFIVLSVYLLYYFIMYFIFIFLNGITILQNAFFFLKKAKIGERPPLPHPAIVCSDTQVNQLIDYRSIRRPNSKRGGCNIPRQPEAIFLSSGWPTSEGGCEPKTARRCRAKGRGGGIEDLEGSGIPKNGCEFGRFLQLSNRPKTRLLA